MRKTAWVVLTTVALAAVGVVVLWDRGSSAPAGDPEPAGPSPLVVQHGPEPTIGGFPPDSQIVATANFCCSQPGLPPDQLMYGVSVANLKALTSPPELETSSEVRDGAIWVAVSLNFPHGSVSPDSSIDVTVKFWNAKGESVTSSMTIDKN